MKILPKCRIELQNIYECPFAEFILKKEGIRVNCARKAK
jgi:hypothetical protein